jgi:hypothetical protein
VQQNSEFSVRVDLKDSVVDISQDVHEVLLSVGQDVEEVHHKHQ